MAVDDARARSGRRADGQLLEREGELASLDALAGAMRDEEGLPALIEGPAGIGKTRLLAELRERLRDEGARVLTARGSELERGFPFGVVRQLFEPLLVEPRERERLLSEAAAAARPVFEQIQPAPEEGPRDATFAALHGLYWLTVNAAADGPLLLSLDDLHWSDRPSLRYVTYLVRRLEGLPVIVAATLRSTDPGTDPALIAEIAGDPATVSVRPGPLSEAAVGELVAERLGETPADPFRRACHQVTGGNPLLLRQLLRSLEAESVRPGADQASTVSDIGPRAVSRTVLLRLARLPEEAAAVARATAILGEGATVADVAALSGVDRERAARITGTLAQAEILRGSAPLGFVHPLVREAIYQDVPPGEREIQHARAARLLAEGGGSPERVAAHLLLTPPWRDPWVVETLRAAADAALRSGASESAVLYLRRAIDEPPADELRASLLLQLGLVEASGSGLDAVDHLRTALEELDDPELRGQAAYGLARVLAFVGSPDEATEIARGAAAELPEHLGDLSLALEAVGYAATFFGGGDWEALRALERVRETPPGGGPGARMVAAVAAYDWSLTGGSADASSRLALDALADGVLLEAENGWFTVIATVVLVLADREEALEAWNEQLSDAHRRGALFAALGVHLWRGWTLIRRGELDEGIASVRQARDEMLLWGGPLMVLAYNAAFLCTALVEKGDLEGAQTALEAADRPPPGTEIGHMWLRSRIELRLAQGGLEEALADADEYEGMVAGLRRGINPSLVPWRSVRAEVLDRLGRSEEAIALVEEEVALARRFGAPGATGRALRILGTLRRERGIEDLRTAVDVLDGPATRLEHAKALGALGTALRLARQPTEAREPLRRGLELAEVCGADALAERLRSELYATGARPRNTALSGVESLTASERRVVELAADGKTNRDIAQALFVTPKTVEVHLSNSYRKLEIGSRRELAGVLTGS